MIPNKSQFSNVSSLDAKRAESQAAKSPFGPIQTGQVKLQPQAFKEDKK